MAENKKEAKQSRYILENVATQTMPVIVDSKQNRSYSETEALLEILNKIEELRVSLA